ncbi:MAG: SPOR domain-containing protein [Bacteroidetes bacterium]|nr:SPOR domain-containing protein [Bacteroidota bacterium]MCY4233378.1 SPOR domain-containing protein [Bacteroidota bacterium]
MIKLIQISISMILLIIAVGCSPTTVQPLVSTTVQDSVVTAPTNWADYEDVDVDQYFGSLEATSDKSFHDVPDILLANDSELTNSYQERQGFRIQVLATLDKQDADRAYEDALLWWESIEDNSSLIEGQILFGQQAPVYLDFHPPYYRLRVGNFIDRESARQLLEVIQRDYEGAFIAPGVILVQ